MNFIDDHEKHLPESQRTVVLDNIASDLPDLSEEDYLKCQITEIKVKLEVMYVTCLFLLVFIAVLLWLASSK